MIIKLIKDFKDFLEVRRLVEFANPLESIDDVSYVVNRCDEETEMRIKALTLYSLQKDMVLWEVSPEWVRGFKAALDYRLSLIKNNRKLIIKK